MYRLVDPLGSRSIQLGDQFFNKWCPYLHLYFRLSKIETLKTGPGGSLNSLSLFLFSHALFSQVIVPSTTCLWVMIFYLIAGTIMFAEWEHWNYLDSVYFCVTSLLKIGFGDFVPGAHDALVPEDAGDDALGKATSQAKLVTTFVYLLVGMGVVAMCYYLLKEEVTIRFEAFKKRMQIRWLRLKVKLGLLPASALAARLTAN